MLQENSVHDVRRLNFGLCSDGGDVSLRMEKLVWGSTSICNLMEKHLMLKLSAGR